GTSMGISFTGQPRHLSPSVAWRMLPVNDASGSVMMLHQMGVDDEINPVAGGYSGLKGCSAIVESGVTTLSPDGANARPVMGIGMVSLAVDVALSPDKSQMALAVPGNAVTPFATVVVGSPNGNMMTAPNCTFLGNTPMAAPKNEVIAVSYSSNNVLLA